MLAGGTTGKNPRQNSGRSLTRNRLTLNSERDRLLLLRVQSEGSNFNGIRWSNYSHPSQSFLGFCLKLFLVAVIFFSSFLLSIALKGTEVRILCFLGRFNLRSLSRSLSKASFRFCAWDRCSVAMTVIPDGRCIKRTAVSVLFFLWPPGPLDLKVSMRTCFFRVSGSVSNLTAQHLTARSRGHRA